MPNLQPAGDAARSDPHAINLSWLVRVRWCAVVGQLVTIAVVDQVMKIPLPLVPLVLIMAAEAATNLAAQAWLWRHRPVQEVVIPLTLTVDVLALTGLLFFTGGPFNPFSFLYLVHIALAAVVLRSTWTWALVGLSLACSGALFYGHIWLTLDYSNPASHADHMRMHLEGMWIAFAVAAGFIVYFVTRIRRALSQRESDLAAERVLTSRNDRLASLATLAAGAAHELATPLGTIAVVVHELQRRAERDRLDATEDLRLIRAQVDRCRGILDQMAADAGETAGEGPAVSCVADVVEAAARELPPSPGVVVTYEGNTEVDITAPRRALSQALRGILKNAQEASPRDQEVAVQVGAAANMVRISVRDRGAGMTPDVLARAGEPFFTTKAPGSGMGLGLFLARTVVERLGGHVRVRSTVNQGTAVDLFVPIGVRPNATSPLPPR